MSFFMLNPDDLPDGIRETLESNQANAQIARLDSGHLHQWLIGMDESVAGNVELMLHWINRNPQLLALYLHTVRTSNHIRFGWCLMCGEDHTGAEPGDEMVGHTQGIPAS